MKQSIGGSFLVDNHAETSVTVVKSEDGAGIEVIREDVSGVILYEPEEGD